MHGMIFAAIAAGGAVSLFTDWLFMGVLFHARYNRYPETWRPSIREQGDTRAIVASSAIAFVTSGAVVALCVFTRANDFGSALTLAALAWIAGPLVVVATNALWMRIDPAVSFAHALGYLARFLTAAVAYVLLAT